MGISREIFVKSIEESYMCGIDYVTEYALFLT